MTTQPLSTRRRTDEQPTVALSRRSDLATELLVLAATLVAALATAWVLTHPWLGLATLAGLALTAHVVRQLRDVVSRYRPTPLQRVVERAGR